jgi:hypothetical protein
MLKEIYLVGEGIGEKYPNWLSSEKELRELRQAITFAIFKVEEDLEKISVLVEGLLNLLERAKRI